MCWIQHIDFPRWYLPSLLTRTSFLDNLPFALFSLFSQFGWGHSHQIEKEMRGWEGYRSILYLTNGSCRDWKRSPFAFSVAQKTFVDLLIMNPHFYFSLYRKATKGNYKALEPPSFSMQKNVDFHFSWILSILLFFHKKRRHFPHRQKGFYLLFFAKIFRNSAASPEISWNYVFAQNA